MTFCLHKSIADTSLLVSEHHERQTRSTVLDLLHSDHIQPTLTEHFQFKVQNYGIVYQRILETAHQSIGLNAN